MVISGASLLAKIKECEIGKKIMKIQTLNGIRESTAPETDSIENRLKVFMAFGMRKFGRIR